MMNRHGLFWQRENFDRMIRSGLDFLENWIYI